MLAASHCHLYNAASGGMLTAGWQPVLPGGGGGGLVVQDSDIQGLLQRRTTEVCHLKYLSFPKGPVFSKPDFPKPFLGVPPLY